MQLAVPRCAAHMHFRPGEGWEKHNQSCRLSQRASNAAAAADDVCQGSQAVCVVKAAGTLLDLVMALTREDGQLGNFE